MALVALIACYLPVAGDAGRSADCLQERIDAQAPTILIITRSCRLMPASRLRIRLVKYFRSRSVSAARRSSPSTIDAVASSHGPFTTPRMLHGATRTRGLLRMRLTFHDVASV